MVELADLLRRQQLPVTAVRAIVANTPADIGSDLYVVVPSFDGARQQWGPCRWSPSLSLPAAGDECLLVLTEPDGVPWVITATSDAARLKALEQRVAQLEGTT